MRSPLAPENGESRASAFRFRSVALFPSLLEEAGNSTRVRIEADETWRTLVPACLTRPRG